MKDEPKGSLSLSTLRQINALLDNVPARGSQGKLAYARVQAEVEAAIMEAQVNQQAEVPAGTPETGKGD